MLRAACHITIIESKQLFMHKASTDCSGRRFVHILIMKGFEYPASPIADC